MSDTNVNGGVGNTPAPPASPLEAIEILLANMLVMQKMYVAKVDAMLDIMAANDLVTPDQLKAIDDDIRAVLQDIPGMGGTDRDVAR